MIFSLISKRAKSMSEGLQYWFDRMSATTLRDRWTFTADPAFGSLGVLFTMGGKTAKRARVPLEGATLRGSGVYVVTMPFTEAVHGVSCFLTYRGLDADRRDLFRTGPGGPPRSWAVLGRNVGTPDDLLVKLLE